MRIFGFFLGNLLASPVLSLHTLPAMAEFSASGNWSDTIRDDGVPSVCISKAFDSQVGL